MQTFFLATQEKGYYVLNDILHLFPEEAAQAQPQANGFGSPVAIRVRPAQQPAAQLHPRGNLLMFLPVCRPPSR